MPDRHLKVFISYTGEDLAKHAKVVVDTLVGMEWIPVDHQYWGPSGRNSVDACREKVAECHIMVLLVAHRHGWVPDPPKGDGRTSITRMEYQWAREMGIPVVPFVSIEEKGWPESCVERLQKPEIHEHLEAFKAEIRANIAAFFTHEPGSLLKSLEPGLREAAKQLVREPVAPGKPADIIPWKLPYLCDRSQQSRLAKQRFLTQVKERAVRPLSLFVHGNADEAHRAFVDRIEERLLPEVFSTAGPRRECRFVHLPAFSISTTQDFGADFRHALSDKLQTELGSDAEVLATLRNLRVRGVGIVLWLCASECKRAPEKILQSVRDYWSAFPDLPPDLLLTCILCVKYDEKPGFGDWLGKLVGRDAGKGPLRSAVESLAGAVNDQPQAHVCVLPELKSATRKDIDEWIADAKDALSRHVSEAELRKMFGDLSALPMDDAIKHLEDLLQSRPRV